MTERGKTTMGHGFPPSGSGPSEPDDPRIGEILGGRFRVVRSLGKGQMARVYVAEQISMDRNVAVKVMLSDLEVDETAVGRFRQEVAAVSRLHSPHTIEFYDFGMANDGSLFIAMELLAGETVRQRLDRDGPMPPIEVASVVRQVGAALDEAHDADVLHRDLKPENVHFCVHATPLWPFVKVLDFGLAKLLDTGPADPTLTGRRQTVGTPAYMAPERIIEGRAVDARSDLYSLAVMAFEMLTGSRPYNETTPMKMVLAHVKQPIPSARALVPTLPAAIDVFFARAMAKDPEARPGRGEDLGVELASALLG